MPAGPQHDGGHRSAENMIELDFSPDNLMEEIDGDGWLKTGRPVGQGPLNKLPTIGGRGIESRDVTSDTRSDPRK
jgi:hypothetical protein